MENEIWRDVIGYEGIYQISNYGKVKSLSRTCLRNGKYPFTTKETILKPQKNGSGYLFVRLSKDSIEKQITIHQLVAITFLNHKPNKFEKVVDHIDNNKLNNYVGNLQIVTNRENSSKDTKSITSQYTGVCWSKSCNKYQANIMIDGKVKGLGYFTEEYDAHLAYQKALKMYNNGDLSFMQPKEYSSKYKGVNWSKAANKWQARVTINKKTKYLGLFDTEEDAYNECLKYLNND